MKTIFEEYLKSIGMGEPLIKRVSFLYDILQSTNPEEIEGIFVTEYINRDGVREYQNLWFFNKNYCNEIKEFITRENFDVAPIGKRVIRINFEGENYDFKKATEKSRLQVVFYVTELVVGVLKASKENCDRLKAIADKYLIPNIHQIL